MKDIKRWHVLLILTTLLCLIPLFSALATTGTVTASSLNMRAKASADSNVVGVLRQGDKVTIKETSGSWYKVTGNGKTGYVAKKYVSVNSGSSANTSKNSSSGSNTSSSNGTCKPGDNGNAVRKVQNRLIALGYLSSGSADGDYGNKTKNAVIAFQKNNGLTADGVVGQQTLNKLNSSSAKKAGTSSSASSSSNGTCKPGDKGDAVKKVQNRLIALGYLASGSADGDYGNKTKNAVIAFQKNNGLSQTGTVNANTLNKLNSSSAKKASSGSTGNADGTCAPGDKGDTVRKVQRRLKALGYLDSVDGDYGNQTRKAVQAFQKKNGLSVTGTVNSATLKKLNSSDAKKATASSNGTERLDWFHGGSNTIPKGATFKVKDIWTGKIFTVRRWSGYNHLDAEPLTRSDTNIMKAIYGHWSWKRRPILVKYNGHVYAASMNGMPHGTSTISGNGFDGHFCIHFYGSKTHASNQVDQAHQNCVAQAMNYSW